MKSLKNEKGQSLVEFAIILPILLLVVMAILEFGMMLNNYLTIQNAAREGARVGIAGGTDTQIQNDILATSPSLKASNLTITITPSDSIRKSGDMITVNLKYNYHVTVPIISTFLNKIIVLNAATSMRVE